MSETRRSDRATPLSEKGKTMIERDESRSRKTGLTCHFPVVLPCFARRNRCWTGRMNQFNGGFDRKNDIINRNDLFLLDD